MPLKSLLGIAAGICAVVGVYAHLSQDQADQQPIKSATPKSQPPAPRMVIRHLILQVEGDADRPAITWITPKPSDFNATRGIESEFAVVLLDATGKTLGSYPLDLSHFDLDPARVGAPLRTQGCGVRDTKIATITNVPFFAATTSVEVRRGTKVLSTLSAVSYARLLEEGEQR